jgi:hypothetical protein
MIKVKNKNQTKKQTNKHIRKRYPLTVQRFLKSSLSGYSDSGENLKVSTCITSPTDRCLNTYNRLKDIKSSKNKPKTKRLQSKKKDRKDFPWYTDEYSFNLARIKDILSRRLSQLKIYNKPPTLEYSRYNKPFIPLLLSSKNRMSIPGTEILNSKMGSNDKGYYLIRSPWDDNLEINYLTDYFTEKCRMTCHFGKSASPLEYWQKYQNDILRELAKRREKVNNYNVREIMYARNKLMYCNNFRISVCLEVLDIFKPKRWLDISAGWGDRLISALLSPWVETYCGVDPNPCLHPGYKSMISKLDPTGVKTCHLIQDGFETAKLPTGVQYDLVFSSPPFFDLEIYSDATSDSHIQYNTVEKWFNGFLMPSIKKSIKYLNKDGYLVLYIGESHGSEKYISRMITETNKLAKNCGRFYYTDGSKLREFYCWCA